MVNRTYRLPKAQTAAEQCLAALAQFFGEKALGKPSIRVGQHSNKVRIRSSADFHDRARALIYLGLLDATIMGRFA